MIDLYTNDPELKALRAASARAVGSIKTGILNAISRRKAAIGAAEMAREAERDALVASERARRCGPGFVGEPPGLQVHVRRLRSPFAK